MTVDVLDSVMIDEAVVVAKPNKPQTVLETDAVAPAGAMPGEETYRLFLDGELVGNVQAYVDRNMVIYRVKNFEVALLRGEASC